MLYYLYRKVPFVRDIFQEISRIDGASKEMLFCPAAVSGFPEAQLVGERGTQHARIQTRGKLHQRLKRALYSAQYNWSRKFFTRHPEAVAMAWNGTMSTRLAFMEGARAAGAATIYCELAPLPGRFTMDPEGVNQMNSLPRTGEFYRDWRRAQTTGIGRWREMKSLIVGRPSARKDVTQTASDAALVGQNFIFCPLQVPNDTQIRQFSGWVRSVQNQIAALSRVAKHLPEGWHFRVKEHPSAAKSFAAELAEAAIASGGRVVVDNATDTFLQVAASRAVLTVNSSVGLQAFFFDKPVIVLGEAFFRIPGLVDPVASEADLIPLCARADHLTFDPDLRDAFMSYLDLVYYPHVEKLPSGGVKLDPAEIRAKLAEARARAGTPRGLSFLPKSL